MSVPWREPDRRAWQPRERLMVAEYVTRTFPDAQAKRYQVRLGAAPLELQGAKLTDSEAGALRVWSRWADAIVEYQDRVILIEAKIRPKMGPLEALLLYRVLLPSTPGLELGDRKVELRYVYAVEDPVLNMIARELGIAVDHYEPAWLRDYLSLMAPRERRAPPAGQREIRDGTRL